MLPEKKFDTGEVLLNYAEGPPNGPPLVLSHGLPGRWQEFLPIMDSLSKRWQIFALDMRGQGLSGHVPGSYLPKDYSRDSITFLKNRIGEPAVIFGMSASGTLAIHTASTIPDLIRGLVIGDSPIDLASLAAWMNSAPFAAHFSAVKDLVSQNLPVSDMAKAFGEMPVRLSGLADPPRYRDIQDQAYLQEWAETHHTMDPDILRYHAALRQIYCPTLLLRGDPKLGALLSAEAGQHAASILKNAASVQIDGTGHSLGLDGDPAPLLKVVNKFLDNLLTT